MSKPLSNNQIRAKEVRLIDADGTNLGLFPLQDAVKKAQDAGLDLVQVTEKVNPPVCKITDYGKHAYQEQKKERQQKKAKAQEVKGIRLRYNISPHDLETRVKAAEKFLNKGDRIKVEMWLRGRERGMRDFATEKMEQFAEQLKERIPIKVEREIKKEGRGLTMIIGKE